MALGFFKHPHATYVSAEVASGDAIMHSLGYLQGAEALHCLWRHSAARE
jgi:hypothetical protein